MKMAHCMLTFKTTILSVACIMVIYVCPVHADNLLQSDYQGITINIVSNYKKTGFNDLVVNLKGQKIPLPSTQFVPAPPRYVIDLPGISGKKNKKLTLANNPFVRSLRIGAHKDKIRLVLDLTDNNVPNANVISSFNSASVALNFEKNRRLSAKTSVSQKRSPGSQLQTASLRETPRDVDVLQVSRVNSQVNGKIIKSDRASLTSVLKVTREDQKTGIKKKAQSLPATISKNTVKPPVSSNKQRLIDIKFDYSPKDNKPIVRLRLSKRPIFKLLKQGSRMYRISIANSEIAEEHLSLPYFPPHDFKGFTLVRAEKTKRGVNIFLGTDHGTKISALPDGNDIIVKVRS
ncbi:MAG: AMIN domain-containing protein [Candidatus Dadabacteria bacterium]|nr:MAG: AMIN domain-containing protein [Candidatus Dadabacteria bacterium]